MKHILFLTVFLLCCSPTPAWAALEYLGQGDSSLYGSHALIYDTEMDITWFDYSNTYIGGNWYNQTAWAAALSVDFGGNTYEGWRLPMTPATTEGYDHILGEFGHLYYTELGNPQGALNNTGDFQDLLPYGYWTSSQYPDPTYFAWTFNCANGYEAGLDKNYFGLFAMAVHPGRLVPEPATLSLLGLGALALLKRRK